MSPKNNVYSLGAHSVLVLDHYVDALDVRLIFANFFVVPYLSSVIIRNASSAIRVPFAKAIAVLPTMT